MAEEAERIKQESKFMLELLDGGVNPSLTVVDKIRQELRKGSELLRIWSGGSTTKVKVQVSEDDQSILVNSKKAMLTIDIDLIRIGLAESYAKMPHLRTLIPHAFSIIYSNEPNPLAEPLDLITNTDYEFSLWTAGLQKLVALAKQNLDKFDSGVAKRCWLELFGTMDVLLGHRELSSLLARLNCQLPLSDLKERIRDMKQTEDGRLSFAEFLIFLRTLRVRPEIEHLFSKYANQRDYVVSASDLRRFLLAEQQRKNVSLEECEKLVSKYCKAREKSTELGLDVNEFSEFLESDSENRILVSAVATTNEMSHPLSHYYIASSHNTYLTGDQFRSASSAEMYTRALRSGCRCLEVDIWDGWDGEPVVYHGHTLTSKISFVSVLYALRDHAFASNPYPVILSFENHCSLKQQIKMAEYMRDILGEKLALPSSDTENASPESLKNKILIKGTTLPPIAKSSIPSPSLVQTNPISSSTVTLSSSHVSEEDYDDTPQDEEDRDLALALVEQQQQLQLQQQSDLLPLQSPRSIVPTVLANVTLSAPSSRASEDSNSATAPNPNPPLSPSSSNTFIPSHIRRGSTNSGGSASGNQILIPSLPLSLDEANPSSTSMSSSARSSRRTASNPNQNVNNTRLGKVYLIAKELSDVTYLKAKRFAGFQSVSNDSRSSSSNSPSSARSKSEIAFRNECTSFGEVQCEKMVSRSSSELVEFTKSTLVRVYPKGTRVDSSNFNPVPFWNVGCQLVALNYQTSGLAMWLNHGKFLPNGKCGYVLKPEFMRSKTPFDPNSIPMSAFGKCRKLEVTVLSARQLPKANNNQKGAILDPHVVVSIYGTAVDTREFKTRPVKSNGLNPNWNEKFEFPLRCSSLALLLLSVESFTSFGTDHIGHFAIPIESIQPGYRTVPLLDRNGKELPLCSLLCKFALREEFEKEKLLGMIDSLQDLEKAKALLKMLLPHLRTEEKDMLESELLDK